MQRDTKKLQSENFDVLIIGAGIYGATAAMDAATRGLSVAIIDQGDFGGATSANSLKIVHGGLRYLQQLDIKRMRESIRERRLLLQMAPHLVHPLSCVMPTYGHLMKGPEVMAVGLLLNDIISYDRNRLDDPQKHIPMGRIISQAEILKRAPGMDPHRVNGGVLWTDAQMFNSDRLNLAFLQSAVSAGAEAANYVKAENYLLSDNRVYGIQAKDCISGEQLEIRAKAVVNMAGGWTDELLTRLGRPSARVNLSTAMNVIVNRDLLKETAAGLRGQFSYLRPDGQTYHGNRILFLTPWRGRTIIGTYHRPYTDAADELRVRDEEIHDFLKEVNSAYPGDPVTREEISLAHKGFLPMDGVNPKTGDVQLTKHYRIFNHAKQDGIQNLISVVGVKYTTARDVSEKVVSLLYHVLGRKVSPNRTRYLRVAGGDISRYDVFLAEALASRPSQLEERTILRLVKNYGSNYRQIIRDLENNGKFAGLIPGSEPVLRAEIFHAVKHEMACHLTDVVLRRTDLGSAGNPGMEALRDAAQVMATLLGWSSGKVEEEIRETVGHYERMGGVS